MSLHPLLYTFLILPHLISDVNIKQIFSGGILAILFMKKLPRVKLAMCMMTLMGLSMGLLGLVFYLKDQGIENNFINFLPVIGLCIYCFCFGAGKRKSFLKKVL